ncbi:MAG: thioredoxin domain-containing protein [Gammaproteobacteria bacterium]|nr:thioredoxin domain-containing protein [Gammaproteobacteria bacterium]MBI5615415.1 thioredoxin domain-containing protein [Gammaproteobacteria bacterium]
MTDTAAPARNALHDATSPYLLQHAGNPVDWYPWGPEAHALARRLDKPILLSIGYSACHWCHVMAHESFEDPATAAVMNEHFVNVKVDREERPDLDRIYQNAHQLLSGRGGGWPLTVFLSPRDHVPFFAGTYFPPEPRYGMPGFRDVLSRVAAFYHTHDADVHTQNARLSAALAEIAAGPAGRDAVLSATPLDTGLDQALQAFDREDGGFGGAPKFPHAGSLARLLRADGDDAKHADARRLTRLTLDRMAAGGLYDQLGGGFFRYSTDAAWRIPHFEKMLYDNGPLLDLYAEAWRITGEARYAEVARGVAAWLGREMTAPEGAFHSSLDADSEGEEGRFYVWTRAQVAAALGPDYPLFAARSGLDGPPNFEGHWHLQRAAEVAELAPHFGVTPEDADARLAGAARTLLHIRAGRERPGCDDKVLVSWNALTIKALARAGMLLGEPEYVTRATRALDFIRDTLWQDGRLRATWRVGRARLAAYLDDHAFLLDALLALLEARWRRADLDFAIALADTLLARFEDTAAGGFFFTAHDHEALLARTKSIADDALPAGAGIAAYALNRLGHVLGESRYLEAATRTLRNAWPALEAAPMAHEALLSALEAELDPPEIIVVRAPASELETWLPPCRNGGPERFVLGIPAEETTLPGLLATRVAGPDRGVAYVCRGTHCELPLRDPAALAAACRPGRR